MGEEEPSIKPFGVLDRSRYRLGKWIEHRSTQFLLMAFSLIAFTMFGAALIRMDGDILGPNTHAFSDCVWAAWTFMADPGTHAGVEGARARLIAGFVSSLGEFICAS
jgi:hypothetical protein